METNKYKVYLPIVEGYEGDGECKVWFVETKDGETIISISPPINYPWPSPYKKEILDTIP